MSRVNPSTISPILNLNLPIKSIHIIKSTTTRFKYAQVMWISTCTMYIWSPSSQHIAIYFTFVIGCIKNIVSNACTKWALWPTRTLHVGHTMVPSVNLGQMTHPKSQSKVSEPKPPLWHPSICFFHCWVRCQEMRSKKLSKGRKRRLEQRHSQRRLNHVLTSDAGDKSTGLPPQSQGKGKGREAPLEFGAHHRNSWAPILISSALQDLSTAWWLVGLHIS